MRIPGSSITNVTIDWRDMGCPEALRNQPGRDPATCQRMIGKVSDGSGYLVAVVSRDGGLWHLSVSHRDGWEGEKELITRAPTWDELKLAKYELVPEDVPMALEFPRKRDTYVDLHPSCLHLWETCSNEPASGQA